MIIDDHTVITGSFNFTKSAEEKNAENLLIIDSKPLAKQYYDNFLLHEQHSENCLTETAEDDTIKSTHRGEKIAKEPKHRSHT
jgi:phosphatidylserine/phosphatidylglycerophosphate/cardiolipin synthase-like enzyme